MYATQKKEPTEKINVFPGWIGIGDVNSNYDRNLSGGSSPVPADVDSDMAGLSAKAWTDRVGALEGLGALGSADAPGGTENSYLMAGIAYYAHSEYPS